MGHTLLQISMIDKKAINTSKMLICRTIVAQKNKPSVTECKLLDLVLRHIHNRHPHCAMILCKHVTQIHYVVVACTYNHHPHPPVSHRTQNSSLHIHMRRFHMAVFRKHSPEDIIDSISEWHLVSFLYILKIKNQFCSYKYAQSILCHSEIMGELALMVILIPAHTSQNLSRFCIAFTRQSIVDNINKTVHQLLILSIVWHFYYLYSILSIYSVSHIKTKIVYDTSVYIKHTEYAHKTS